jgi:lysophospholipase L1-like esterase
MKNNHPAGSYVIDGLSHTELQDPYNTTYFDSGLHPTSAGYAILTPDLVALLNTL